MREYIEREADKAEEKMPEYIDRTPFLRDLTAMKSEYDGITINGMIKALQEAPAADVVEVARCIKCVHRDKKGVCQQFRQRFPFFPEDDFFCGFGAKMDGKGEGE